MYEVAPVQLSLCEPDHSYTMESSSRHNVANWHASVGVDFNTLYLRVILTEFLTLPSV